MMKAVLKRKLLVGEVVIDFSLVSPGNPAAMRLAFRLGWEWNEEAFWKFGKHLVCCDCVWVV